MGREFFKRCAAVALGLALLYVGLRAGLNYSGFCLEQRRYLTDREKIEIAIKRILSSYPTTLTESVTYPDGRKATASANVRVRYQVRYLDASGPMITKTLEPYIAISNCGRART